MINQNTETLSHRVIFSLCQFSASLRLCVQNINYKIVQNTETLSHRGFLSLCHATASLCLSVLYRKHVCSSTYHLSLITYHLS